MPESRTAGDVNKVKAGDSSPTAEQWTRLAWLVCAAAFGFYLFLAWGHPAIYWYDAHNRMALRDQVLIGRWLPLTQLIVFLVSKLTPDLLVLRGVLAGIATLTVFGLFRVARQAFGPGAGLISAGLLASDLIFAALATVPYPDVLFLGLTLTALYYLGQPSTPRNLALGMLALNLACLTRYEGWMLAAIVLAETGLRSFWTSTWKTAAWETGKTAALASAAPLAWLILGVSVPQGLVGRLGTVIGFEQARPGTNPFLPYIDPVSIRDFAVNFYHLLKVQAGIPVILAGMIGWLLAVHQSTSRSLHVRLGIFVLMDWCLLALWRPWPFSNLRQAFITQAFLILYAGFGLVQVTKSLSARLGATVERSGRVRAQDWAAGVLAAAMIVTAVPNSARFVGYAAEGTDFYFPQQVGAWLNTCIRPGDAVWVLSDDVFPAYALATYTGRPFNAVLDHRFDEATIRARLSAANQVYVVEMFHSSIDLTVSENALLNELEDGRIKAQRYAIASTPVWVVSSADLLSHLASR